MTQDAVPPGRSYVYRFRAPWRGRTGTTRTSTRPRRSSAGSTGRSSSQPRGDRRKSGVVAVADTIDGGRSSARATAAARRFNSGRPVHLRLVNSADAAAAVRPRRKSFRVVAIDAPRPARRSAASRRDDRGARRRAVRPRVHDAGDAGAPRRPRPGRRPLARFRLRGPVPEPTSARSSTRTATARPPLRFPLGSTGAST